MRDNREATIRLDSIDYDKMVAYFTIHYSGDLTFEEVKDATTEILAEALFSALEDIAHLEFTKELEGEARLDMPVIGLLKWKP